MTGTGRGTASEGSAGVVFGIIWEVMWGQGSIWGHLASLGGHLGSSLSLRGDAGLSCGGAADHLGSSGGPTFDKKT